MDLGLANRVALIAGSSRGIGKAIAARMLDEGSRVCVTGRDRANLDASVAEFKLLHPEDRILAVAGDLTDTATIRSTLTTIRRKWGGLDILVANLGTGSGKAGWDQSEEDWDRLFRLNFWGSVRLAQAAIPLMIEQERGCIVFISSIAGLEMTPAPLPYSAAKAALLNYSKNLARIVAANGIRVNTVAPGNVLFPGGSWELHLAQRGKEVEQYIAQEVPMKRFGTPDEIAGLVTFLCSQQSAFSTGACYVIDGGQTHRI